MKRVMSSYKRQDYFHRYWQTRMCVFEHACKDNKSWSHRRISNSQTFLLLLMQYTPICECHLMSMYAGLVWVSVSIWVFLSVHVGVCLSRRENKQFSKTNFLHFVHLKQATNHFEELCADLVTHFLQSLLSSEIDKLPRKINRCGKKS